MSDLPCRGQNASRRTGLKKIILILLPVLSCTAITLIGLLFGSPVAIGYLAVCGAISGLAVGIYSYEKWPVTDEQIRYELLHDSLVDLGKKYSFDNLAARGIISPENAKKLNNLYSKLPTDGDFKTRTQQEEDFTNHFKHKRCLNYLDALDKTENKFDALRSQQGFLT